MPRTSFVIRFDTPVGRFCLLLITCLVALPPLAAAAPGLAVSAFGKEIEDVCRDALPLPLTHSIDGYATAREPARYALEVAAAGLLVIEAHATG